MKQEQVINPLLCCYLFASLEIIGFSTQPALTPENETKPGDVFEAMSRTMFPRCTQIFARHFSEKRLEPPIRRAIVKANEDINPVVILRDPKLKKSCDHFMIPEHYDRTTEYSFNYYQGFNFKLAPQCRSFFIADYYINVYKFIHRIYLDMEISFIEDYFIFLEINTTFKHLTFSKFKYSFRKAVTVANSKSFPRKTWIFRECPFKAPRERITPNFCDSEINGTNISESHQVNSTLMFPDFPKDFNKTILVTPFDEMFRERYYHRKKLLGYNTPAPSLLLMLEKYLNAKVLATSVPRTFEEQEDMLQKKEIDFVTSPCSIAIGKRVKVYADVPLTVGRPGFIIRNPRKLYDLSSATKPFNLTLWIFVLSSFFTVFIFTSLIWKADVNSFEVAFLPLIFFGVTRYPENFQFRLFYLIWLLTASVISASYSGALLSSFVNPSYEQFAKNFLDLITMNYKCYTRFYELSVSEIHEYESLQINESTAEVILDHSISSRHKMLLNVAELEKKCYLNLDTNLFGTDASLRGFGASPFKLISGFTYLYFSNICAGPNDILRPTFTKFMINVNDFGFRNKFRDKDDFYFSFSMGKHNKQTKDKSDRGYRLYSILSSYAKYASSNSKRLSLQIPKSVFLLIVCGLLAACLVLFGEVMNNYYCCIKMQIKKL